MNSSENLFFRREERSLTFEHRPLPGVRDTLRLRMANMLARGYTLQVEATDFPDVDGLTAELRDRYTGRSEPLSLKGVTRYAFAVGGDSLSSGDRFEVVFRQAARRWW